MKNFIVAIIALAISACASIEPQIFEISVMSEWCNHEKNKACLRKIDNICEISISTVNDFASISTMKELCRKGTL